MELLSLKEFSQESRILLLNELGFKSDGNYVLNLDGSVVIDKYIESPVKVDNMLILPESTVILDNNPLSIASYFEEYGELI